MTPPSRKAPKRVALAALAGVVALVVVLALVFGGDPEAKVKQPQAAQVAATATVTPTPTPEKASKASQPVKAHAAKTRPVTRPQKPPTPVFVACDPNITVRAATTTCGLAESTFYEYAASDSAEYFSAYSKTTGHWYAMRCYVSSAVVCKGGDGGEVHFAESAVAAYTEDDATTYAESHKTKLPPSSAVTTGDQSTDESDPSYVAPGDEDPGYDNGDGYTAPGENIPNYDEGNGYRVQCSDGMYSQSGGIQGACSGHGGVG